MSVKDWSSTASSNTGILTGITLDGNVMNVPLVDDAFREMSAQIAQQMGKMNFKGADMPSAATVALDTATGWYVNVTGTTTITSFGTVPAGQMYILRFTGALTITYNASTLILPTAASIVTVGGDIGMFMSLGAGQWRCIAFTRPNSSFLDSSAVAGPSTADSAFTISRSINDGYMRFYGGTTSALGAYLTLYGETHTTNGGDIILGTNNSHRYMFDFSTNIHYWANNTPTNIMILDATGDLEIDGQLTCDSIVQSSDAIAIFASTSGGTIYLRPNGSGSTTEQVAINTNGDVVLSRDIYVGNSAPTSYGAYLGRGFMEKAGSSGSYGTSFININYVGTGDTRVYASTTHVGTIPAPSDYRLKTAVTPLASTWDAVKAMRPCSFQWRAEPGAEHWGFIAHEVQEDVTATAGTGIKDMPDANQSLELAALIAALTRTVQELQARVEQLEAPENG